MRKKDPNSEIVSHSPTDTHTILQKTGAFRSSAQTWNTSANTWLCLTASLASSAGTLSISLPPVYCLHPFSKVSPVPSLFPSAPTQSHHFISMYSSLCPSPSFPYMGTTPQPCPYFLNHFNTRVNHLDHGHNLRIPICYWQNPRRAELQNLKKQKRIRIFQTRMQSNLADFH